MVPFIKVQIQFWFAFTEFFSKFGFRVLLYKVSLVCTFPTTLRRQLETGHQRKNIEYSSRYASCLVWKATRMCCRTVAALLGERFWETPYPSLLRAEAAFSSCMLIMMIMITTTTTRTCQHWVRWAWGRRECIRRSGSSSKPCKPRSQRATEISSIYYKQTYLKTALLS